MNKPTIDIITLGCSKNLVDSESLMALFEAHGYHVTHDSDSPQGEIAVINTCGFIEDAKQESIDTKSIMGIFSLDLSKNIELNIHAENDCDEVLKVLAPYIV